MPPWCDKCDRSFSRQEHLIRHNKNLHEDKTPFYCDLCNISLSRRDHLIRHINTVHEGIKRFSTAKSFSRKRKAEKKNIRQIKIPGEFFCDLCNLSLSRRDHLKRHIKSVHERTKPFSCDVCNATFSRKDRYNAHIQSSHK